MTRRKFPCRMGPGSGFPEDNVGSNFFCCNKSCNRLVMMLQSLYKLSFNGNELQTPEDLLFERNKSFFSSNKEVYRY